MTITLLGYGRTVREAGEMALTSLREHAYRVDVPTLEEVGRAYVLVSPFLFMCQLRACAR